MGATRQRDDHSDDWSAVRVGRRVPGGGAQFDRGPDARGGLFQLPSGASARPSVGAGGGRSGAIENGPVARRDVDRVALGRVRQRQLPHGLADQGVPRLCGPGADSTGAQRGSGGQIGRSAQRIDGGAAPALPPAHRRAAAHEPHHRDAVGAPGERRPQRDQVPRGRSRGADQGLHATPRAGRHLRLRWWRSARRRPVVRGVDGAQDRGRAQAHDGAAPRPRRQLPAASGAPPGVAVAQTCPRPRRLGRDERQRLAPVTGTHRSTTTYFIWDRILKGTPSRDWNRCNQYQAAPDGFLIFFVNHEFHFEKKVDFYVIMATFNERHLLDFDSTTAARIRPSTKTRTTTCTCRRASSNGPCASRSRPSRVSSHPRASSPAALSASTCRTRHRLHPRRWHAKISQLISAEFSHEIIRKRRNEIELTRVLKPTTFIPVPCSPSLPNCLQMLFSENNKLPR